MYSATGEDMVWFFNAYMYFEKRWHACYTFYEKRYEYFNLFC